MSILTSKWMLLLLIPIIVVFVLLLVGQKSVKSETIINAQPDAVWALLTKTDGYPDWNPVMQSAKGNLVEGEKIVYLFKQDENVQYDVPITVKKIVDGKHLNQGGGMAGIVTYDHHYELEALEQGKTKLIIREDYHGVYVPFWDPAPVEAAYHRLGQAVKQRIENPVNASVE